MASSEADALNESVLGTKEYWNEAYTRESLNYQDDPADEGTIWFEDTGAEEKMIEYLENTTLTMVPEDPRCGKSTKDDTTLRILDVGTGNGHLLFALRDAGWHSDMIGIDYSEISVKFAQQINDARQPAVEAETEGSHRNVRFKVYDLFNEDAAPSWVSDGFDIMLDKGTFDAISLNKNAVRGSGRAGWEVYAECVAKLMRPRAVLLITSCNWTEAELRKWLEGPMLNFKDRVQYPYFTFGGVKGQSVTTLCFERAAAV